jgi:plastocyanin
MQGMRTPSGSSSSRSRLLATIATVLLVGGLAACGDDDDGDADIGAEVSDTPDTTSSADDTTTSEGQDAGTGDDAPDDGDGPTVVAQDFTFDAPAVPAGTEVTFSNEDTAPHTLTADDGAFDTGRVDGGAASTFVAPSEPGAYDVHCEIHPDMQATLTVEA